MRVHPLHPWRTSHAGAVALQLDLARRLRAEPLPDVRVLAAADVAYSEATHRMYAALVAVRLPSMEVLETVHVSRLARFPYIPGLFTFRELPPLLAAFRRLRARPDAVMFDGQGTAHPRRCGLACHAGLLLEVPTVGCAKSLLVGEHGVLGSARGSTARLVHEGSVVGAAVRTRDGVAPVYVSPGHRADLESSIALVLATTRGFRLPEPVRLAHRETVTAMKEGDARVGPARVRSYPDFVKE